MKEPRGSPWVALLDSALRSLVASPGRTLLFVVTMAVGLFWPLAGLALAEGLRLEARQALEASAPIFVSGDAFGGDAPVALGRAAELRELPGCVAVVPRIAGRVLLDQHFLSILALDPDAHAGVPAERQLTLPEPGHCRLGRTLAERTGRHAGESLLLEAQGALVVEVDGYFSSGAGVGASSAVLLHFADAQQLFQNDQLASDLLVYARPGYERSLAEALDRAPDLRVQDAALIRSYLDGAYAQRSGVLLASHALCLIVFVALFLVMADVGVAGRGREIGILKTCGWSTRDVFARVLAEQLVLAVLGGCLAIVLAYVWLGPLQAPWLRAFFVPESWGTTTRLPLPFVLRGTPALAGLLLAVVMALGAGIVTVWRSASVPPTRAVRRAP